MRVALFVFLFSFQVVFGWESVPVASFVQSSSVECESQPGGTVRFRGLLGLPTNVLRPTQMPLPIVSNTLPAACAVPSGTTLYFSTSGSTAGKDFCSINLQFTQNTINVMNLGCFPSGYPTSFQCQSGTVLCIRNVTFDAIRY